MNGFNPGDVVIQECMLGGALGQVDVRARVHSFSVFEHILKPYTSIVMKVIDNADIINTNVGLDGTNTLKLSFSQPTQDPYVGNWTLTSVEKARNLQSQRTAVYTLVGYSNHMLKHPKVQKSYRDIPATSVAQDLITNFLGPNKPLVIGAPARSTVGNKHMPYNVNGIGIHKAIRSVLLRAASSVDESSAYLWFENQHSMIIDTLENLMGKVAGGPKYIQRPMGQNFAIDVALQQFTILRLREENRTDQSDSVLYKKQATNTFDFFSNKFQKGETNQATTYLNIPYNIMRPPTFAAQFLNKRKEVAGKFDSQSVTIEVALNPELTVGEGFAVDTLAPSGDTDLALPDLIAGNLLASEVRHTVNMTKERMQGTTTVKGVRGGLDGL